jgi:DedD protein
MLAAEDTEITIGTGKMLALFFGLVALCAVFFGLGFSLGRSSVKASAPADGPPLAASTGTRPSAVKSVSAPASPELTFYKAVERKDSDAQLGTNDPASAPATDNSKALSDPAAPPPMNGYYVQVAAVSKQDDAQALVDALKKKQYSAFATTGAGDKLFHVQLGPFGDVKEAESTRAKLVNDGYNPILKK